MPKYNYPNKIPFYKFIVSSSKIAKNPIPVQNVWLKQNKDIFFVKPYFQQPVIITCKSEIAKDILQKKHKYFHKSKIQTQFLSKYIGYGLLTSSGDYWLQQRRLIQPGFHREKIKSLVDVIDSSIKSQLDTIPLNKEVDLYSIMNELAFEVVAKSLFNFSAKKDTLKRLQFIIEKLQQFITIEIRQPYKKLGFLLSGEKKYHRKLVKESRIIIETIIIQRKELVSKTLKYFDEALAKTSFARVHKSYLVNVNEIVKYRKGKGGSVVLSNGKEVMVSASKKSDLLSYFK